MLLIYYIALILNFYYIDSLPKNDTPNRIILLHTNDIHSHYLESNIYGTDCTLEQKRNKECFGGVARMQYKIQQIREKHPDVLLLDAGDQFQGTPLFSYYKGNVTVDIMNRMKYDLMTIGNHEFDLGVAHLSKIFNQMNFPIVCCNVEVTDPSLDWKVVPYVYLKEYDMAIIGYISKATEQLVNGIPNLIFLDPLPIIQSLIKELQAKGIKRIIALSHNGYGPDIDILKNTSGLSLIVGGHSHSYLSPKDAAKKVGLISRGMYPTEVINLEGKKTYLVQAYCWARFLGYLDLTFNNEGYLEKILGSPIDLDSNVPKDPDIENLIMRYQKPIDNILNSNVGFAKADFNLGYCQTGECSMGNLICDGMMESIPDHDLAIMNSGGIRATLSQGEIKVKDILTIFPFKNIMVSIQLTGFQLKQLALAAILKVNPRNGMSVTSFLQLSHVRLSYLNNELDLKIYNQTSLEYTPIKSESLYKVLTVDFIANNGDNLIGFITKPIKTWDTLDEIMKVYIQKHSPISPTLDYRINIKRNRDRTHQFFF